ncbi:MAG: NTP transferase domain-containing protein [Acidobacteria bacterium]|nr:NTP transferase domain-containing protein [Acidobacteriota bacterium]
MTPERHNAERRAGVIAAGQGERLRKGVDNLKPLVAIAGRPLVERVLTSIAETAPAEVAIIVNEASTAVRERVEQRDWPFLRRWIVETTPSSMHSFLRVVETLARDGHPGPFLLSTVDTVATSGMYRRFAAAAAALDADVVLAVNRPGDDEKPLLVRRGADGFITAIGSEVANDGADDVYATAGFYMVRASVLREAAAARREQLTALRLFLARLLACGLRIAAVPVAQSIDVDHPEDVAAAERFLAEVRS